MAIYGLDITSEDVQEQFMDEVASEIVLPASEIIDGSVPEFQANSADSAEDVFSMGKNDIIPSGIPNAVDKLWKYHNRIPDIDPPVSPVLKLRNFLVDDYKLDNNYNGVCVELDTTGFKLRIETGSVLLAL